MGEKGMKRTAMSAGDLVIHSGNVPLYGVTGATAWDICLGIVKGHTVPSVWVVLIVEALGALDVLPLTGRAVVFNDWDP